MKIEKLQIETTGLNVTKFGVNSLAFICPKSRSSLFAENPQETANKQDKIRPVRILPISVSNVIRVYFATDKGWEWRKSFNTVFNTDDHLGIVSKEEYSIPMNTSVSVFWLDFNSLVLHIVPDSSLLNGLAYFGVPFQ